MKIILGILIASAHFAAFGQGILFKAGDVYSFEFTSAGYQQSPIIGPPKDSSNFWVSFGANTLDADESLLVELYPDSLSDAPLVSDLVTGETDELGIGFGAVGEVWMSTEPPYWPDLQGVARITMLKGSVDLYRVSSRIVMGNNEYSQVAVVPEPNAVWLGLMIAGVWFRFQGRKSNQSDR